MCRTTTTAPGAASALRSGIPKDALPRLDTRFDRPGAHALLGAQALAVGGATVPALLAQSADERRGARARRRAFLIDHGPAHAHAVHLHASLAGRIIPRLQTPPVTLAELAQQRLGAVAVQRARVP